MKYIVAILAAALGFGTYTVAVPAEPENLGALRVFTASQGGTGIGSTGAGNIGRCLSVSSISPFAYTFADCAGGSTSFSTTSADAWILTYDKGFFFSTTSIDHWETTQAARGGSGGTGTVGTSSVPTVGHLSYWTNAGTPSLLGSVATGTLSGGTGLTVTGSRYVIGGSATIEAATNYVIPLTASTTEWATAYGWGNHATQGYLTAAITSLNGLTGASQTFATTSNNGGFGFSSAGTAHTLNIPTASASSLGLLSAANWTTFNAKENALTFTYPLTRSANTVASALATTSANTWTGLQTFSNSSSSNATTSLSHYFPYLSAAAGTFLAIDPAGKLIATTTPSTGGASDWIQNTNYNTLSLTPSTTLPVWFKGAVYASSTLVVQGNTSMRHATATTFGVESGQMYLKASVPEVTLNETGVGFGGFYMFNGDFTLYSNAGDVVLNPSTNVGIGTTSPYAKLAVVGPVVAQYFVATSSVASVFSGGAIVSGSLQIPSAADPTVDAVGEIALQTSPANALVVATSTNASFPAIFPVAHPIGFFATTTVSWTSTTTVQYATLDYSERIQTGICYTNVGTVLIRVGDGTNWSSAVSVSSATTSVPFSQKIQKGGAKVIFQIGTFASSPTYVSCNFRRVYEE